MQDLEYSVYVLFDGERFYIGYTSDKPRRISEHKSGKVKSTRSRKRLELIYFETYKSKKDAQRRERYYKTTKGKKALKLMLRDTLKNQV
jgi:putative endonuclease